MNLSTLLKAAMPLSLGAAGYLALVRPRVLNWGATPDEEQRIMPGDDILPDASLQTTRVITIEAAPEYVWPWLVQMGPRPRAGAYTYDWLERLLGIDIQNTNRILSEYQHLEPGQLLALNKKGTGILVRAVDSPRSLVLQWMPARSTWAFGLYPDATGRTTRLISRNRLPGSGPLFRASMAGFMEPGSLVMERKMLLGIKQRAEALARPAPARPDHASGASD